MVTIKELDNKYALIKEEELLEDEIEELNESLNEMNSGKAKNWADVKKELGK